jgi:holo-[acyl-carrier protein] synthase
MILGIGTDIIQISRIERLIHRFPDRFIQKILTPVERLYCGEDSRKVAKRYALKEATLKALGTGLAGGISWHDLETNHLPSGQPVIKLSGVALEIAARLAQAATPVVHVSATDDGDIAQAFVIITCE